MYVYAKFQGKLLLYCSQVSLHIGEPIDISQFSDINEAMDVVRKKVIEGMNE